MGLGKIGMGLCGEGLDSSSGMEPGQLINHSRRGVCPLVDDASVRGDGEDVGGSVEGTRGNPPTVSTEANVLYLQREEKRRNTLPLSITSSSSKSAIIRNLGP